MIATGGLLRISARRQDSLRSKNRAENKRKRKARKKKKKNDVVVVKGKLKLCSISGLVAGVGILVLLVGIAMAVLGYWPKDSSGFPHEQVSKPKGGTYDKRLSASINWTSSSHGPQPMDQSFTDMNHPNGTSTTDTPPTLGFFAEFVARHMYSDKLKVFGPLIMGIGIFLFICANAVLHENRDKKTKIINLRDIYSTVIDIHSLRTKDCSPLNGFVNYVQSRGIEGKPSSSYSTAVLAKSSWTSTLSGKLQEQGADSQWKQRSFSKRDSLSRERQTFTDTVYSICREQNSTTEQAPEPKQWETRSIVTSSVNAFTLPVIKFNNCELEERRRSGKSDTERESTGKAADCEPEEAQAGSNAIETKAETSPGSGLTTQDSLNIYKSEDSLQGAPRASPQGSQVQLLPSSPSRRLTGSHLSLSALSDYSRSIDLGICPSTAAEWQGERPRRLSCPRLDCSYNKGYIKLGDLGGESFESAGVAASSRELSAEALAERQRQPAVTELEDSSLDETQREIKRQYSNKEKLLMISRSHTTLDDEEVASTDI